jgi:PAS domain S-box-containing protein
MDANAGQLIAKIGFCDPMATGEHAFMREKEYLDAICSTGDGAFLIDANKKIIRWNRGAEKILGLSEGEVLNRDCFRVISGRDAAGKPLCGQNCKIHHAALRGTLQKNFDILIHSGDDGPRWLNITVLSPPAAGEPLVAHIFRDVTRAKNMALALDQFLVVLEHSGAASGEEKTTVRNSGVEFNQMSDKPSAALSGREIEVLTLLAEGLPTKTLAQRLNISHFTARNHIQNILVKLNLHSKAQAVSYAFKRGIL